MEEDCDDVDVAANDFTILVKNIPVDFQAINDDYDDDILDFFANKVLDRKVEIKNVNLTYRIDELTKLQN
jgi:hypothetical protein